MRLSLSMGAWDKLETAMHCARSMGRMDPRTAAMKPQTLAVPS